MASVFRRHVSLTIECASEAEQDVLHDHLEGAVENASVVKSSTSITAGGETRTRWMLNVTADELSRDGLITLTAVLFSICG